MTLQLLPLYIVLTVLLVWFSLALQCFLTSNDTAMTLYVNEMFIPVRTKWFLFDDDRTTQNEFLSEIITQLPLA